MKAGKTVVLDMIIRVVFCVVNLDPVQLLDIAGTYVPRNYKWQRVSMI